MMYSNYLLLVTLLVILLSTASARLTWRGVDSSFLGQVEDGGGVFQDKRGIVKPLPDILVANDINLARIRLWHSPSEGCCSLSQALDLAERFHDNGIDILLDFHFSDSWADPSTQTKPRAWMNLSFDALANTLQKYTRDVMVAFQGRGINPKAVQLGNAVAGGILWPDGKIFDEHDTPQQWRQLGTLLQKARAGLLQAVGSASSLPKIIIHNEHGADWGATQWFFDKLRPVFDDFDVIGLSYYPWYGPHGLADLQNNLQQLASHYGKDLAVVETAYPFTLNSKDSLGNFVTDAGQLLPGYPATPSGQSDFITDLSDTIEDISGGIGVVYWSPDWISAPSFPSAWENNALFSFDGRELTGLAALGQPPTRTLPPPAPNNWHGADISFCPEMEAAGAKYRNEQGVVQPLPELLANHGINIARLHLWHTPPDGRFTLQQTLDLAERCVAQDMGILLDLHLSDTWSNPAVQTKPSAWVDLNFNDLANALHDYTRDVMLAFYARNIFPVAVQLGNEMANGILWPDGKTYGFSESQMPRQWEQLGTLLAKARAGIVQAASSTRPMPKIVLHNEHGGDFSATKWFFDNIHYQGHFHDYDIIGLSFYPWWHGTLSELQDNVEQLAVRYPDKEVSVVETGYPWTLDDRDDGVGNFVDGPEDLHPGYPATVEGQHDFIVDICNIASGVPGCLGVVYWAPGWLLDSAWENNCLFDFSGNVLPGLVALGGEVTPPTQPAETNKELVTIMKSNNGHAGNMFDLKATKNVEIRGFDINARDGSYTVEVYTKQGNYAGHETNAASWRRIQRTSVTSKGQDVLTPLPELANAVTIPAGSKQAFYITLTKNGIRYTNGSSEGKLYVSDANLEFYEGIGKAYPFAYSFRPRIWNGRIRYATTSKTSIHELLTTMDSNNGQAGNMFDIEAYRKIQIVGFDINARPGTYTAQVYTRNGPYAGHETKPTSWALIQTTTVTSQAQNVPTPLPPLPNPIRVDADGVQAFYIKIQSPDIRYTNGSNEGRVFARDDNLFFLEGVGKSNGPDNTGFGSTFRPRVWNGKIRYIVV